MADIGRNERRLDNDSASQAGLCIGAMPRGSAKAVAVMHELK